MGVRLPAALAVLAFATVAMAGAQPEYVAAEIDDAFFDAAEPAAPVALVSKRERVTDHHSLLDKVHELRSKTNQYEKHTMGGALARLKRLQASLPKHKAHTSPAPVVLSKEEAAEPVPNLLDTYQRVGSESANLKGVSLLGKVRALAAKARMPTNHGAESGSRYQSRLTARLEELEAATAGAARRPSQIDYVAALAPVRPDSSADNMMGKVALLTQQHRDDEARQVDAAIESRLQALARANELRRQQLLKEASSALSRATEPDMDMENAPNPIIAAAESGKPMAHPLMDRVLAKANSPDVKARAALEASQAAHQRTQQQLALSAARDNERARAAAEAATEEQESAYSGAADQFQQQIDQELAAAPAAQMSATYSNLPGLGTWTGLAEREATSSARTDLEEQQDKQIEQLLARARTPPMQRSSLSDHLAALRAKVQDTAFDDTISGKLDRLRQRLAHPRRHASSTALRGNTVYPSLAQLRELQAPPYAAGGAQDWPQPLTYDPALQGGDSYQAPNMMDEAVQQQQQQQGPLPGGVPNQVPYTRYYDNVVTPYELWQNPALNSQSISRFSDGTVHPSDMRQYNAWPRE